MDRFGLSCPPVAIRGWPIRSPADVSALSVVTRCLEVQGDARRWCVAMTAAPAHVTGLQRQFGHSYLTKQQCDLHQPGNVRISYPKHHSRQREPRGCCAVLFVTSGGRRWRGLRPNLACSVRSPRDVSTDARPSLYYCRVTRASKRCDGLVRFRWWHPWLRGSIFMEINS